MSRAVEVGRRLVQFKGSGFGYGACLCNQFRHLLFAHQVKALGSLNDLVKHLLFVNPSDHNRRREVESVVQALDRRDCLAFQDDAVCTS